MNKFRFIKGYLKILISGDEVERFMNLCCNHDICLWDILHEQNGVIMKMFCRDFFKIRPIVKKTKTKVVILKKNGLPFIIVKMKKRVIFTFGILFCIVYLGIMSSRIWAIEIIGNQSVSTDIFLDFLVDQNIYYGMPKTDIEYEDLEASIRQNFNIITWASVQLDGTKLVIKINENIVQNKAKEIDEFSLDNSDQYYNLVATKEGTIVSIVTRAGIPQVEANQVINKGDPLILGALPILGEDLLVKYYDYVEPDADILLSCNYEYSDSLPFKYYKKVYTGEKENISFAQYRDYFLPFFHNKMEYENYIKYDTVEHKKQVKLLDNFYLPIFYGKKEWREYEIKSLEYSQVELEALLYFRLNKYLLSLEEKGVQIIEKNVNIEMTKNNMSISGSISVIEETGTPEYLDKYQIEIENQVESDIDNVVDE